jgi:hypothetical protein
MQYRSTAVLITGLALGWIIAACHTNREPTVEPSARAQPAEGGKQAPPEIKKGVKVRYTSPVMPNSSAHESAAVVQETRGNWVRLTFRLSAEGKKAGAMEKTVWVNFETVNYFTVIE